MATHICNRCNQEVELACADPSDCILGHNMNNFYVQIIAYKDDEVVKEMGPFSEQKAEKVDSGATRNMNHEKYYTLIVQKDK